MSTNGLDVFDRTINTTNAWLSSIMGDSGLERPAAWQALGAVLRTLRNRLPLEVAAHFGGQLPLLIRGAYYERWQPSHEPEKYRHPEDFVERVRGELGNTPNVQADRVIPFVMAALIEHVDPGQMTKVEETLPKDVRSLWEAQR